MSVHFVTGASGFFGSRLTAHFKATGRPALGTDLYPGSQVDRVLDLHDPALGEIIPGEAIIHHCAGTVPLAGDTYSDNLTMTAALLEALKDRIPARFIYYSTSAVFGGSDPEALHSEWEVPTPLEAYGASKLAGENLIRDWCERNTVPWVIIRPRMIVGPGRKGLLDLLYFWIRTNRTVFLPGPGARRLQLLHTSDLLSAVDVILENAGSGIFHAGGLPSGDFRGTIEALIRETGSSSTVMALPVQTVHALRVLDRIGLPLLPKWQYLSFNRNLLLSCDRLVSLGWKPRYGNYETLFDAFQNPPLDPAGASVHENPMNLGVLRFFS